MAGIVRSCTQSMLKLVNSIMGMAGMAMIMYALWMIWVLHKHMDSSHSLHSHSHFLWFIYTLLGAGVTLCVITCAGHVAAETANGFCLYFYMVFVFLVLVVEAAVTADIFLNGEWEEDFPKDKTGNFRIFIHFVKSNFDFCRWIGLSVVSAQGLSILFALILKALGPHRKRCYDSDDEYVSARRPLLNPVHHSPPFVVGDPLYGSRNDSWSVRINDKTNR